MYELFGKGADMYLSITGVEGGVSAIPLPPPRSSFLRHTMDDATAEAVRKWKERCFRPTDLPFAEAVDSLGTDQPLVHVCRSQTRKTDWVVCYPNFSQLAIVVGKCSHSVVVRNRDVDTCDLCIHRGVL